MALRLLHFKTAQTISRSREASETPRFLAITPTPKLAPFPIQKRLFAQSAGSPPLGRMACLRLGRLPGRGTLLRRRSPAILPGGSCAAAGRSETTDDH